MLRVRVPEFVRALEHPRDGVAGRTVQRDLTFACLVLAVPDVERARNAIKRIDASAKSATLATART